MASTLTDRRTPRHLLIFEPDHEGHPREWLQHLLRFAASLEPPCAVSFVVAPEICTALERERAAAPDGRIKLLPLGPRERRLCTHRHLAISGLARWWVMRRYLRQTGAEAGHFLTMDLLSLPLALGLRAAGRPLGGVLFRPSVHYRAIGSSAPRISERVRDLRKAVLYRLMLLNRALRVVLTLDPYFPAHAARRYRHGDKVRSIVDPVHPPVNVSAEEARLAAEMPGNRIGLLLFGYLTERKGVLVLLEALRRLPSDVAARAAVMMAGNLDRRLREAVEARRAQLAAEQPALWLRLEDRRLAAGEIAALIKRCEVILAPYQRFVGSSGVLLWAADAGKPVLTQEFGLVGRLVRDHGLGLGVDASDPAALAEGIARMIEQGPASFIDRPAAHAFAQPRTAQRFASDIFASLLEP